MSPTTLRLAADGPVGTISLARPDTLNAINATVHAELREVLDRFEADGAIRVVVLTGEGRAFSGRRSPATTTR
jgi:2-(1,2-epoxy-1,2-dihydrophenyl)acetyl-CoA isomerase